LVSFQSHQSGEPKITGDAMVGVRSKLTHRKMLPMGVGPGSLGL
jgi:hypothetical protein